MKKSPLKNVHPLLKIASAAVWISAAVILDEPVPLSLLCAIATVFLLLAGAARRPLFLAYSLVSLGALGGLHLLLEGTMTQALVTVCRLYVMLCISFSLMLTTDPADLLRSLRRSPLPAEAILGLSLMWRSAPVLQREFKAIALAAKLEGKSLSIARPGEFFRFILLPLAFSMTGFADDLALSLQSRGIGLKSYRQIRQPEPLGKADIMFAGLTCVALLGALSLQTW